MRALTLIQPWAGLVASGIKLAENRPRHMIKREDFDKPFAIHAGRSIDEAAYEAVKRIAPELFAGQWRTSTWSRLANITSAVVAVATILDVVHIQEDTRGYLESLLRARRMADQIKFAVGPVVYLIGDVRTLAEPVPCRGNQGFWTLPTDVERAVVDQVGAAP